MTPLIKKLYASFFSNNGFHYVDNSKAKQKIGYNYQLDSSLGYGNYWIYPVDDLFLFTNYTLKYKTNYSSTSKNDEFISIGNCSASNTQDWFGSNFDNSNEQLVTYVGHKGTYNHKIKNNDYITCTGLAITPKYYNNFLCTKTNMDYKEFSKILIYLNKFGVIPELSLLFHKLKKIPINSNCLNMYLESKMLEVISLILLWYENNTNLTSPYIINTCDEYMLQLVEEYIIIHYKEKISLDTLSCIACMSKNKLMKIFKKTHNITISEYIQNLRIKKAKELLLNLDTSINNIALQIGYKRHSSFTEVFKRSTGFSPTEFRNANVINK